MIGRGLNLGGVVAVAGTHPLLQENYGRLNGSDRAQRQLELLNLYSTARLMFRPTPGDVIITARKGTDEVVSVTHTWMLMNGLPDDVPVFYLQKARTLENVIEFKARVINQLRLEDYYEDNLHVLKGLQGQTQARLHHVRMVNPESLAYICEMLEAKS